MNAHGRPTADAVRADRRGVLHLAPIDGSVERQALVVDIELERPDGVLVLGDLRRAAESATAADEHETAHRIWTVVAEAASRVGNQALVGRAGAMADGAHQQSRADGTSRGRRGVTYDYNGLARDRASGMSQAAIAEKWGCSPGTVARAVRYVAARDELTVESEALESDIRAGVSVNELADRYDTAVKIMRWIVSDYWDRRS